MHLTIDYGFSIRQACKAVNLSRSMYYYLKNLGYKWNHKRVYRIYKELKMNIKKKAKRRLPDRIKEPLEVPDRVNQVWSIDFMSDSLYG